MSVKHMSANDPQPQRRLIIEADIEGLAHKREQPATDESAIAEKWKKELTPQLFGLKRFTENQNTWINYVLTRAIRDAFTLCAPATDDKPQNRCPISYAHLPHDYCDGTAAPRGEQWTPERVGSYFGRVKVKEELARDINAELATEHYTAQQIISNLQIERGKLVSQLAAEREKRDRIAMDSQSWGGLKLEWRESDGRHYLYDKDGNFLWSGEPSYNIWRCVNLHQQLLAALAAIAEHNRFAHFQINVDLSALDKHDADVREKAIGDLKTHDAIVRKPLVDALEQSNRMLVACSESAQILKRVDRNGGWQKAEKRILGLIKSNTDALAKVKEGK